ncbi:MAG: hypothetical protein PUB21_03735 [Bacteroidales bacterium]|nr:hypothetical protein [Bacteroidales bacterium]
MKSSELSIFKRLKEFCIPQRKFSEYEERIVSSAERLLRLYPLCTLQDIYKSFFQDRFGPGHLITDEGSVSDFLDRELDNIRVSQMPDLEYTGWEHNFIRVHLRLVKNNIIPRNELLRAFIESANSAQLPSIDEWKKEWKETEKIIRNRYPDLFLSDKSGKDITALLDSGQFAMHHSAVFDSSYCPHYRIIATSVFNNQLKQYLTLPSW